MKSIIILLSIACILSCGEKDKNKGETQKEHSANSKPKKERPNSFKNGKFFNVDDKIMLYGGKDSTQHFDVSNSSLKSEQFHYGIGREAFPALLKPDFISVKEADSVWADSTRFIVARSGNEVKAYSIKDLTKHEVVNDVLNSKPIMAVYCILADLGAIYERQYDDEELTFALSGYTYYDNEVWNGLDGFVLWDRETESLWWPLIGKAVSGSLKGVKLIEMDKAYWEDTTWGTIKQTYPNAKVLKSGQDFERPKNWKNIDDVSGILEKFSATRN